MTLIVERYARTAPFGVRFFDVIGGVYVPDLVVTVTRRNGVTRALKANVSGVFVLHDGEYPTPETNRLSVHDPSGRFFGFTCDVRIPSHGLADDIALFSTASRPLPEAMAVIRADLFDPVAEEPAAYAVVEVLHEGHLVGRGVADGRGQAVVIGAYPAPASLPAESPPSGMSPPRAPIEQTWEVDAQVAYAPWMVIGPPNQPPNLDDVLAQMASPRSVFSDTLVYNHALILRTARASRLFVSPVGSPP